MLLALAAVILHVSQVVVHVLLFGAALCALVHFIRVRRVHRHPNDLKEVQR